MQRKETMVGYIEKKIARRAGVSRQTVWRVLNGKSKPRLTTAARMAAAMGMSLDAFYQMLQADGRTV